MMRFDLFREERLSLSDADVQGVVNLTRGCVRERKRGRDRDRDINRDRDMNRARYPIYPIPHEDRG